MQLKIIEKRIERIRRELQDIGPMRPGSLNKQYTVCGKSGCRCIHAKNPRKHGPYYQLSYVHKGKSTSRFIRPQFVREIKKELLVYKTFRRLTDEWVRLALEASSIGLAALRKSKSS